MTEANKEELKPMWKIHDSQEDGVLIYFGERRPISKREYVFQLIDGANRKKAEEVVEILNRRTLPESGEVERLREALEEITNLSTGDCGDWVMKARWIAERAIEKALLTSKPEPVAKICPDCRGLCGKADKKVETFTPCKTCGGNGSIPVPVAPVRKWEAEGKSE